MEIISLAGEVIDISLPISCTMPIWPGDPRPQLTPVTSLDVEGVQVSQLLLGTHTGTHLDAPKHFIPGGRTIDQLDLNALVGVCRVVEVVKSEGPISRADLQRVELAPRRATAAQDSQFPTAPCPNIHPRFRRFRSVWCGLSL